MKKRILIVDDEPEFSGMLKLTLEANGYYECLEENDAAKVRAAARQFDPDVILLDIMMPRLDGSEVAAGLKEDPLVRNVPVIFLTALVSRDDAPLGSYSSGGQTFLPKDIRVDKLMRCIEEKTPRLHPAQPHSAAPVAAR